MKLAWGITGAGHFLRESFEIIKELKRTAHDLKVTTFVSRAGEEVIRMYGLMDDLRRISDGSYLEETFFESQQGASAPKTGRFLLNKYDALIISPATSNTTAKLACGIADTLITNAAAQAVKGGVHVYVVPVDISGFIESEMPFFIDREICMRCEICLPAENCMQNAITDQIELLKCNGCGTCVRLCSYGAIRGGKAKLRVRDVDSRNVMQLRKLEGITVLESPGKIFDVIAKPMQKLKY
ncbi:MAG: dihydromethanopterin reductase (acceptor) [Candidatus Methanoperedens sp.]|nr:dihydromethanopterin reductase (acceptor) [Candidatus Methanoperedens sp.]